MKPSIQSMSSLPTPLSVVELMVTMQESRELQPISIDKDKIKKKTNPKSIRSNDGGVVALLTEALKIFDQDDFPCEHDK